MRFLARGAIQGVAIESGMGANGTAAGYRYGFRVHACRRASSMILGAVKFSGKITQSHTPASFTFCSNVILAF